MGTGNLELGLREFGLGPRVDWSRENQEAEILAGRWRWWSSVGRKRKVQEVRMQKSLEMRVMREAQ